MAVALLGGIRMAGLSCPEDLAVIGVDDTPMATLSVPALSTIRVPLKAMADDLVRRTLIEFGETPSTDGPPTSDQLQVIVRQSA